MRLPWSSAVPTRRAAGALGSRPAAAGSVGVPVVALFVLVRADDGEVRVQLDLDLAAVVKRAASGEVVLDPRLNSNQGGRSSVLTPRELEVLQLICDGKSNREIAAALNLSVNTVAVHRANIMNTLGIHKTAELVVYAIRNGLVHLP